MQTKDYNPRFLMWCRACGVDPAELERDRSREDIPQVYDPETEWSGIWTVAFMFWIDRRLDEWGQHHGFRGDYWNRSHEQAALAGHIDFDLWLHQWVEENRVRA